MQLLLHLYKVFSMLLFDFTDWLRNVTYVDYACLCQFTLFSSCHTD